MKEAIKKSTIQQIGFVVIAMGLILSAIGIISLYDPNVIGANIAGALVVMVGSAVAVAGVIIILADSAEKRIQKAVKKSLKKSLK